MRIPGLNASLYLYADSTRVFKYLYVRLMLYIFYLCVTRMFGSSVPEFGRFRLVPSLVCVGLCCHNIPSSDHEQNCAS